MTIDDPHGDAGSLFTPAPTDQASRSDDLMAVFPATAPSLADARKQIRCWLDTLRWPSEQAEDIELAVNEAIANVIDHAYPPDTPGTATLHCWVSANLQTRHRRVVVTVTDRGRWTPHHLDGPAAQVRGHGLLVMSGYMPEFHIQRTTAGTTVIMISYSVPF